MGEGGGGGGVGVEDVDGEEGMGLPAVASGFAALRAGRAGGAGGAGGLSGTGVDLATFLAAVFFLGAAFGAGEDFVSEVEARAGAGFLGAAIFSAAFFLPTVFELPAVLGRSAALLGAGLAALASFFLPGAEPDSFGADDFSGFMRAEEGNCGHPEGWRAPDLHRTPRVKPC